MILRMSTWRVYSRMFAIFEEQRILCSKDFPLVLLIIKDPNLFLKGMYTLPFKQFALMEYGKHLLLLLLLSLKKKLDNLDLSYTSCLFLQGEIVKCS